MNPEKDEPLLRTSNRKVNKDFYLSFLVPSTIQTQLQNLHKKKVVFVWWLVFNYDNGCYSLIAATLCSPCCLDMLLLLFESDCLVLHVLY